MIVSEQFVQEVNRLWTDKSLILSVHKAVPIFPWESPQDVIILRIKLDVISIEVLEQIVCTEHLGDFDQLI